MEKGFRTFQCPGCFSRLKFPVSEEDYGKTKTVRCPKCGAKARVEIPCPAPFSKESGFSPNDFDGFFLGDILGDLFKKDKK